MIKLTVTEAQNQDYLGEYTFYKNLIYIGSNHQSDLYFSDTNLLYNHIFIEVIEQSLILHLHEDVEFIHVNDKRTTHFKILKIGDRIKCEDICIRVDQFNVTEYKTRKVALNEAAVKIPNEKPELIPLISRLNEG